MRLMILKAIRSNHPVPTPLRRGFFSPIFWGTGVIQVGEADRFKFFLLLLFLLKGVMNCGQRGTGEVGENQPNTVRQYETSNVHSVHSCSLSSEQTFVALHTAQTLVLYTFSFFLS
jgi:hypothetical protein